MSLEITQEGTKKDCILSEKQVELNYKEVSQPLTSENEMSIITVDIKQDFRTSDSKLFRDTKGAEFPIADVESLARSAAGTTASVTTDTGTIVVMIDGYEFERISNF